MLEHLDHLLRKVHPETTRRILALPFEDQEIVLTLKARFPLSSLTVLRKQDLAGLSASDLIRKVRSAQWDLVIASLHNSAVKRSQISVELLLSFSKSRERFVRIDRESLVQISTNRIAFHLLPRLLLGSLVGATALLWTYVSILLVARKIPQPFTGRSAEGIRRGTKTVLFLRTDLSGAVRAGGSVSHVKGMVKAFTAAGFNVIYVADAPLAALPQQVTQLQIQPLAILDFFDELQLIHYNLRVIHRLGAIVRQFRPSLIYQRHAIFNFAGGAIAGRYDIPMILEANDSEVWIKKHWSRLLFEDLGTRCEALALEFADRIAVVSAGVEEQLSRYRIERKRYLLNPNGVDPEEFRPDIDGAPIREQYGLAGHIVVGFIGSFTRWHGVETLFDAAVSSIQRESTLRFLMIGEGDLRSALQRRAADLGLEQSIIFTGLVPHSDAPRHLAASDILVSPHLGFEDGTKFFGSPTKLFEYMAMGKPIIASRLEQIGEVVRDGENGLQMTPGDASQLAVQILDLARDRELRTRLGAAARQEVVQRYTWKANVDRILKSFETEGS
jgi:glycosyltransferase involved in cell wall biosynthesis